MKIFLQNSISNKKELFEPKRKTIFGKPAVSMYHCGPTVYDFAHIGNLRSYVFADIVRRTFEYAGYKVRQAINITDIGHLSSDADEGEDKMLKGLKRENLPKTIEGLRTLARRYEDAFKQNLTELNIETVGTKFPRASEHVDEELELIKKLDAKGFVYKTEDGIYFDTTKDQSYGKLGHLTPLSESTARVEAGGKRNPRDFALWKFSKESIKGFDSAYGEGFPGWHIECSAMSMKYLGETIDIHTGGVDHIPVHHNNEIAQSENATGKEFARVFMHNAFISIDDGKMAKSEGNFITLKTVREKGFSPLAYRYFLLGARYSTPMNFTWEALTASENALRKLKQQIATNNSDNETDYPSTDYALKFESMIGNDLDTPGAIAIVWDMVKDQNISHKTKKKLLARFDTVLGLDLCKGPEKINIPDEVQQLLSARDIARKSKDWKKSDELREKIKSLGFEVMDIADGQELKKL